ncbi:DUF3108 domain-containing protein [Geobacter sp. AOG1]|uniref:DUF3108 domain-containing protein n=1 Tax=Geobacter sp. AOG1 TaxID=1566346 RepID=UPI001CC3B808|nr:DUF3108 domain-containing protein [Geobacter sp. AOG1]GFE57838.1 hypothetical protein AOG1_17180 [Geobacter sp. AOG1]
MNERIRIPTICVCLSVMAHFLLLFPLGRLGSYNFARPVNLLQAVTVDVKVSGDADEPAKETTGQELTETVGGGAATKDAANHTPTVGASVDASLEGMAQRQTAPEQAAERAVVNADKADTSQRTLSTIETMPATARKTVSTYEVVPPLRTAGEFLATEREKLSYQISMFGFPVGSAELEAKNERGEVRITLKVTSNAALASLYPVDDFIETRHIAGNFIVTKIRQQEGSLRSNRGFTLFLRDKKVFWHNLFTHKSSNETVPTSDVLDLLSGFYYLRGRPLKVGTSEMLQVYDSDQYTEIPVQVLRRERVSLPGFRKADTIVIKPQFKTDGIFKRTGDVTIWLADDNSRAPVKVETQIPLGKVTVELLSAEKAEAAPTASPAEVRR